MSVNDLTDQNIQDTYKRVVQTDGTNLADGTGSLLPISFDGNNVTISGSITANEYIVSSSVTNIVIATKSGSTAFGDSTDDIHQFTGSVNISGNISASGNMSMKGILNSGATLTTHLTASGNISAIGDIVATNINGTRLSQGGILIGSIFSKIAGGSEIVTVGAVNAGSITSGFTSIDVGEGAITTTGTLTGGAFVATGNTTLGNAITDTHTFTGHITASGNISASGNIYAQTYSILGTGIISQLTDLGGTTTLNIGNVNNSTEIEGTNIKLDAPVTASGNISASGDVFAGHVRAATNFGLKDSGGTFRHFARAANSTNELEIGNTNFTDGIVLIGNITASGNISSSGQVQANTFNVKSGTSNASYKHNGVKIIHFDNAFVFGRGPSDTVISGSTISLGNPGDSAHVTASGNISASGNIIGAQMIPSNLVAGGNSSIDGKLHVGGTAQPSGILKVTGTSEFTSHITASGNISASGNIYSANEKTINYGVYLKSTNATKWWGPKKFGVQGSGLWNQSYANAGSGTEPSRLFLNTGFAITEKAKFVRFHVSAVVNTGTADLPITASFAVIDSVLDTDQTTNPLLVHLDSGSAITDSDGSNYDQIQISSSLGAGTVIPKNSMVYPRFKWGIDQTSSGGYGSQELYLQVQFTYIPIK